MQLCTHARSRHRRIEVGGARLSCGGDLDECQLEGRAEYLDDDRAGEKDLRDVRPGTRLSEAAAEGG